MISEDFTKFKDLQYANVGDSKQYTYPTNGFSTVSGSDVISKDGNYSNQIN